MKTFLFCTSFLNKETTPHRKQRYLLWLYYYMPKLKQLGVDHVFLINDGQEDLYLHEDIGVLSADNLPSVLEYEVNIIYFKDHLGRKNIIDFPGWWRSFTFSHVLSQKYSFQKIIHIESDFFVLSDKLFSFIKKTKNGWVSLFCNHYNFPETAIQIICKDYFESLSEMYSKAIEYDFSFNNFAEYTLPFSIIQKEFVGDRLGEFEVLQKWVSIYDERDLDYIGQINSVTNINFMKRFFNIHIDV